MTHGGSEVSLVKGSAPPNRDFPSHVREESHQWIKQHLKKSWESASVGGGSGR